MQKKNEAKSLRRREIAKRRAKLGFQDNGAEEMDDEMIDRLERFQNLKNSRIEAAKNRGSVSLVTDNKAIGQEDRMRQILRENEKFQDV